MTEESPVPAAVATAPAAPQSRVARNVVTTVITQLASWSMAFLVTRYLPPYAGDVGFGRISLAMSLTALFGLAVPLGTSTVLVKGVARDRDGAGRLLGSVLALRIPAGLLAAGLLVAAVRLLGYDGHLRALVLIYATGMLLGTVNEALAATLQGMERLPRQNAAALLERFLASGLTVALVFLKAPLWVIAAATSTAVLPPLVLNAFALRRELSVALRSHPSFGDLRGVARQGVPYMGWTVFRGFYEQVNPIVLGAVAGLAAVGWYSAAAKLVGTALFVPFALTTALLPTLSRLWNNDRDRFAGMARRMFALTMLLAVPISMVMLCLPEQVIAVLGFQKDFSQSVPVLRIGGVATLLYFVSFALGTTIIAADRQDAMFRAAAAGVAVGVPTCAAAAVLSDRLLGNAAVGAMAGSALLEAFLISIYLRALPVRLLDRGVASLLGRYALASVPAALLLWWCATRGAGIWAAIPCALVYVAACFLMRAVDPGVSAAMRRWVGAGALGRAR